MKWEDLDYKDFNDPIGFRLFNDAEKVRFTPTREVRNRIEEEVERDNYDILVELHDSKTEERFVVDAFFVEGGFISDIREIVREFNNVPSPEEMYKKEIELREKGVLGSEREFTMEEAEERVKNLMTTPKVKFETIELD